MKLKIAIISGGVRQVHAACPNSVYATLCGLDGGVDGYDETTDQKPDITKPNEKITCPDCYVIWMEAQKYQRKDFDIG